MNKQQKKRLAKAGKPVIKLHFLGAAGHVTGSMNLVEYWQGERVTRFLLDAGLNMENKRLDFGNRFPKGVKASDIDFVILSHAHIDHSGFIPRLVKDGFRGKVYATPSTIDLCRILLPDSGFLQEKAADSANKRLAKRDAAGGAGTSGKVKKKVPLYTSRQAQSCMKYFAPLDYFETHQVAPGVTVKFTEAGHILGSAVTLVEIGEGSHKKKLCFTGNIGRREAPLLRSLETIHGADYLITEATYGNKKHNNRDRLEVLAKFVNEAYERAMVTERRKGKGVILIPAFAVGRAQVVLNDLRQLQEEGRIPGMKVFLDGRMSCASTQIHRDYAADLDDQTQEVFSAGGDAFRTPKYSQCKLWKQSEALLAPQRQPIIIVGSSGMANGGRIVAHLQKRLSGRNNTVLFVGYQGTGTLGQSLVRFANDRPSSIPPCVDPCPKTVSVQGKTVRVRSTVEFMSDYSAHADYTDILWWLGQFNQRPKKTFVVHGDEDALSGLQSRIKSKLHWDVEVPKSREAVYLT